MSRYLESIHIDRYGAIADRDVGPFEAGLNVVYGPNEAGKSTIASFVGGVLFGWEEAHGVRNTYNPSSGQRSGSLVFSDGTRAIRQGNEDGLQGDAHATSDIDSATFKTMFSLTSDELMSLRNSSDVTSRLLTAGSGTGSSPAGAFVEIEQRIAALTSRMPGDDDSIFSLTDRLDEERATVKALGEQVKLRKREDRELRTLHEDRAITARHLGDVSRELEKLNACRSRVERIDEQIGQGQRDLARLTTERTEQAQAHGDGAVLDPKLMQLDNTSERLLRDRLDEYADEQAKALRGVDIAKENAAASSAAYEALMELDATPSQSKKPQRAKDPRAILPAVLAVAFAVAGVPVFVHARAINSLSLSALGIGLVVFGCLLAIAAVAIVARPDRSGEALVARQQDAQWVMLQDKKKLDANTMAKSLLDQDIAAFLSEAGLGEANGSIRQARALLDDAREARSDEQAFAQRLASLDMQCATVRATLDELAAERETLMENAEFAGQAGLEEVDDEIRLKESQREALSQTCDDMGVRIGELSERLDREREDRTFDLAKLRYQQTRVRLREAKRKLAMLLLAKRMLESSIVVWESRSQPEVYRKASELFASMTGGAWRQIAMTSEGRLVAVAPDATVRDVRHQSLGTCQQLYLSLRVAMLLHAEDVGRAVPILADDILVNFDAERRRGAARVLTELSEKRQVIVFTCHRETVEALRSHRPDLAYLEL